MDWTKIQKEEGLTDNQILLLSNIVNDGSLCVKEAHTIYSKKTISSLIKRKLITFENSLNSDFYELGEEGLALFFL